MEATRHQNKGEGKTCPIRGSLPCHGEGACITQQSRELCCAGPPKTDRSRQRVATKCGPFTRTGLATLACTWPLSLI